MRFLSLLFFAFLARFIHGETHTWYFETGWVDANPDGTFERKMIGFNNTWPLPILRVKKNDRVQLYLTNGFDDNKNTTLHFHGMFQNGTNQMDGPEMVTQCPIPPGETYLYNFTVGDQVGTYWYHSHTTGQYGDGMRGAFVIEDDDYPYEYDEEVVLTLSEHYHKTSDALMPDFLSRYNPTGAEPIPQNFLFNETRNVTWNVEPNKTYLLRIINTGRFTSQYLYMEDHEFEVVEVDGIYVEKNVTDMIYITTAQRYTALVRTKNDTSKNYAFMNAVDSTMLDVVPKDLALNGTNYIVYDDNNAKPDPYTVDAWDILDDFYLRPLSNTTLLDDADLTVTVDVAMDNLGNGVNYAFFNNITYTRPFVPTLLTVLSAGEDATNSMVYGSNTHSYVLQKDDVVDIVLNNHDTGVHPFHLHGHVFQVISRGPEFDEQTAFNKTTDSEFPEYPVLRDTVYVRPNSYMVLRFKAMNPGVWFFHCHIEWHLDQGLALIFIEDPEAIQNTPSQQISDNHKDICQKAGVPFEGNAAGTSDNYLNLKGENVQHKPLPAGFTARGIVALVFSVIAAILGMIAISFYGLAEIPDVEARVTRDLNVEYEEQDDDDEIISEDQPLRGSQESSRSNRSNRSGKVRL